MALIVPLCALVLLVSYPLVVAIYNIFFHPLARFPGPKSWAAYRLVYVLNFWRGKSAQQIRAFHEQYGPVVRVAPNELSYADINAWQDIYAVRDDGKYFPKNPIWWAELGDDPPSIISTPDFDTHQRMRNLWSRCFTGTAIAAQEPTIQYYTDLLIQKLRHEIPPASNWTVVNIVEWFIFTTFDIVGDAGFGEPFHCLRDGAYHQWVATICHYFKVGSLAATIRFYPLIDQACKWFVPPSMVKAANDNKMAAIDKVRRRLAKPSRGDFISYITDDSASESLSRTELESNSNVIVVAGSETVGTVLSGIANQLVKNDRVRDHLTAEIRDAFSQACEITLIKSAQLEYLDAVISEGLRMCPPVAGGLQHVVPHAGAAVCGEWLPEGTNVAVHWTAICRSRAYFYDPDVFHPERWLASSKTDASSPFKGDNLLASQPFHYGWSSCIGKPWAYAEIRLILSKLLWNFDLQRADEGRDCDWDAQDTFVIIDKKPFDIMLVDVRQPVEI